MAKSRLMMKSHALLQVGNLVSLISYNESEPPKPLTVINIFGEIVYLKGFDLPFLRSQLHFLKISISLLTQLGFREVSGIEILKTKSRQFTTILDSPVGPLEATFTLHIGMLPNASLEMDGVMIASGKNWIHEIQNAYFETAGRMLVF